MAILRQLIRGIRSLRHPAEHDRALDEEIRHYLAQTESELVASGMSRDQAARAARLEVGNVTAVRETTRTSGWEHTIETFLQDTRYALRGLRQAPVFAITAILTLAIGLGASTAVFSAVSPILLEPLPFPHASRLVAVSDRTSDGTPSPPTLGTWEELRARARSFEVLAAADQWQPSLTGTGDPERLAGERVTADYFRAYGVVPAIGREFTAADDRPGGPRVVMLSSALWERRFGADRAVVGRSVDLDGTAYLVIGVLPRSFADVLAPKAQLWEPMQEVAGADFNSRGWGHHYQIVGRLAPGMTVAAASAELAGIGRAPEGAFPRPRWADLSRGLLATSLQDRVVGNSRPALYAIIGAVMLLLVIASVNVTNLLLARAARRRTELAMRIALGAGRGRLLRQLLTESVVLALAGGALGLAIAPGLLGVLVAATPASLPRVDAIHLDFRAFLFALALTTVVGVVVGLAPAPRTMRADVNQGLRPAGARITGGGESTRSALVIIEVALALVLVVGAGLLFQSVRRLVSVPPGFDSSNLMTLQVISTGRSFGSDTVRRQFYEQALGAVRQLPGVLTAGFTSQLPLSGEVDGYGYEWQSQPSARPGENGSALRYAVSGDYFTAMRIPLKRGRLLDASDRAGAPEAVVINESLARRLFGSRDPLGERVRFGPEMESDRGWDVVVGVVGDVKQYGLAVAAPDAFYVAQAQWPWVDNAVTLVVRTRGDPAAMAPALKRAIWSINATVPIPRIESMADFVAASAGQRRFVLLAIELFAVTALVLAAIGLYGVISGSVTDRIREIGIRTALGATPNLIVGSVVGRALVLTASGGAIGVVGAFAATRLLQSLLFGISRADLLTYAGGAMLLGTVALLAAWGPARRAARVDPTTALRAD